MVTQLDLENALKKHYAEISIVTLGLLALKGGDQ